MSPEYLTPAEAAALIGVAPKTIAAWRCTGKGPRYLKPSRRVIKYRLADVSAFIEASAHTSTHSREVGA